MKKTLSVLAAVILVLALVVGCGAPAADEPADLSGVNIRLASLKGPTTMGLVDLLNKAENGELAYGVESTIYGAADEITGLLINGDIDAAAIPANLASVLYNKSGGAIQVVAVNTLGVLYVVENGDSIHSVEDLRGKTIYSTGKGTTPEFALNSILTWNGLDPATDVTIEFKSEATEIAAILQQSSDEFVAVLPQPYVTSVLMQNEGVRIALDLTAEWNAASPDGGSMVTGVMVMRTDFIEQNPEAVAAFLADYKTSTENVNADPAAASLLIEKYGIVAKAAMAQKALPFCNITFVEGAEMKTMVSGYLNVLYDINPQSVGGNLPDDAFYYSAS